MKLKCSPNPCDTCPYRKDVPPGIWDREEYDKLPAWDEQFAFAGTFLCHNGNKEFVCRGWLEVHERNMSARLAMFQIEWDETNRKPTKVSLYRSGAEARRAGLRGVNRPGLKAKLAVVKILKRRISRSALPTPNPSPDTTPTTKTPPQPS